MSGPNCAPYRVMGLISACILTSDFVPFGT